MLKSLKNLILSTHDVLTFMKFVCSLFCFSARTKIRVLVQGSCFCSKEQNGNRFCLHGLMFSCQSVMSISSNVIHFGFDLVKHKIKFVCKTCTACARWTSNCCSASCVRAAQLPICHRSTAVHFPRVGNLF